VVRTSAVCSSVRYLLRVEFESEVRQFSESFLQIQSAPFFVQADAPDTSLKQGRQA
jgi:hypothetical protein